MQFEIHTQISTDDFKISSEQNPCRSNLAIPSGYLPVALAGPRLSLSGTASDAEAAIARLSQLELSDLESMPFHTAGQDRLSLRELAVPLGLAAPTKLETEINLVEKRRRLLESPAGPS